MNGLPDLSFANEQNAKKPVICVSGLLPFNGSSKPGAITKNKSTRKRAFVFGGAAPRPLAIRPEILYTQNSFFSKFTATSETASYQQTSAANRQKANREERAVELTGDLEKKERRESSALCPAGPVRIGTPQQETKTGRVTKTRSTRRSITGPSY